MADKRMHGSRADQYRARWMAARRRRGRWMQAAMLVALLLGAGCSDRLVDTGEGVAPTELQLTVAPEARPAGADRVRLRVTGGDVPEQADVALPAPGEVVSVPVEPGTYAVSLVLYHGAAREALGFVDTSGVVVEEGGTAPIALTPGRLVAGPDYLLGQEVQVRPEATDVPIDTFFTTPDLHPSLPSALLHYGPEAFDAPETAPYSTPLTPELDNYYVGQLTALEDAAFVDSVYFRVALPLRSAWAYDGDALRVITPSVATAERPYRAPLDQLVVVEFLQRLELVLNEHQVAIRRR